ncbi:uncharacterized protein MONBRDRAFT_33719 [Monosiga brevicollis MX1]|uniref:Cyclin n=1 Tax=Monosiga brevicollis TaxID=81824 RepID=A9V729_MONBE|nr:uncharacterized protein MONBRDRAFT_33719 [Monosiga brevicollis MX1]EDQ86648.1 predicted protein [Monosiga brevicollis MX1]|eukprot:XP_001748484.1 hypothetical protein [Monosiga brevicollis MX1]
MPDLIHVAGASALPGPVLAAPAPSLSTGPTFCNVLETPAPVVAQQRIPPARHAGPSSMPPQNNIPEPGIMAMVPSHTPSRSSHELEDVARLALLKEQLAAVPTDDMLTGVAMLMDQLALSTQANPFIPTKFDAPAPLNAPLSVFISQIVNYRLCSRECTVLALVYGQRLLQRYPSLVIDSRNVHRIFLIAIMLASKLIDDRYCRNTYYAAVGGLTVADLNRLEMEFCFLMGFDLCVSLDEFREVCQTFMWRLQQHQLVNCRIPREVPGGIPSPPGLDLLGATTTGDYVPCPMPVPLKTMASSLQPSGWGNLLVDDAGYPQTDVDSSRQHFPLYQPHPLQQVQQQPQQPQQPQQQSLLVPLMGHVLARSSCTWPTPALMRDPYGGAPRMAVVGASAVPPLLATAPGSVARIPPSSVSLHQAWVPVNGWHVAPQAMVGCPLPTA